MEKQKPQRLDYIDIARGIGVLLMLAGHTLAAGSTIRMVIYSFHMPLFFILSGYTASLTTKPWDIIKRRTRTTWAPYLIWVAVYLPFSIDKIPYLLYGTIESINMVGGRGPFWFLPCMWFASIIGGSVAYYCNRSPKVNLLLVISSIVSAMISLCLSKVHKVVLLDGTPMGLPLALDVTLLAAGFYLFGVWLKRMLPRVLAQAKVLLEVAVGLVLCSASLLGTLCENSYGYQRMASYDIDNIVLFVFTGIVVSVGVVLLCHVYAQYCPKRWFVWCGQNSLTMYAVHPLILYPLKEWINPDSPLKLALCVVLVAIGASIATFVVNGLFSTSQRAGKEKN